MGNNTGDRLSRRRLVIPSITAFIASFCIMVVELIAGRIVARYLGTSIYTWTSVIGTVLAGIALGSFCGGWLGDKFRPAKTLSVLFFLASLSCVSVPLLNYLVGEYYVFWVLPWSLRIFLHVLCVFLVPSVILGMIGAVVAKFALDQGLPTGRTVGFVYAWSAVGSIVGTFCAGFLLISIMGTLAILWTVAGVLGVMCVFYSRKKRAVLLWPIILAFIVSLSFAPFSFARIWGQKLKLRQSSDPSILYQKESNYSFITVRRSQTIPGVRKLILDRLLHSIIDVNDPFNIQAFYQYPYLSIYDALTRQLNNNKGGLRVLVIGGGGYVWPRYLLHSRPESNVEVVEIDPEVTRAAVRALGFSRESPMTIHHMDARNYIDELLWRSKRGQAIEPFDVIYADALSGLSVPYQLTTKEFNEKIGALLSEDGVYMVNVIDSFRSGRFLGALLNTFGESFDYVYVFAAGQLVDSDFARNTFVIVGSLKPIDTDGLSIRQIDGVMLTDKQLEYIRERSRGLVLTDDYAPVDNLLKKVVYERELQMASAKITDIGNEFLRLKEIDKAITFYNKALKIDPEFTGAHNNLGNALAQQYKLDESLNHYKKAVAIAPRFQEAYSNIGTILVQKGNVGEAVDYYKKALEINPEFTEVYYNLGSIALTQKRYEEAIDYYETALKQKPDFAEAHNSLGNVFAIQDKPGEAARYYRHAIEIYPEYAQAHYNLGVVLARTGEHDDAIFHYRRALELKPSYEKARQGLKAALLQQQEFKNN